MPWFDIRLPSVLRLLHGTFLLRIRYGETGERLPRRSFRHGRVGRFLLLFSSPPSSGLGPPWLACPLAKPFGVALAKAATSPVVTL
jgi:hypothetical protein